ncbi:MAG: FG-GAP-like repeat-containing protein [Betaproteobacteria bacterium]
MLTRNLQFFVLAALVAAFPAAAHHPDDGNMQGNNVISAASGTEETLTGTVVELVVVDRVNGSTTRYPILLQSDGSRVALRGDAIQTLVAGSHVTVTGGQTGAAFTVTRLESLGAGVNAPPATLSGPVQVSGRFMVAHSDDFATGTSKFMYEVIDASGGSTQVAMPFLPSQLGTGMQVVVDGNANVRGEIVASTITIVSLRAGVVGVGSGQVGPLALTAANYLVIPIKFPISGTGTVADPWVYNADPFTPAAVNTAMFGALPTKSVKEYYNEASYNQQGLTGTVATSATGGFLQASVLAPPCTNYGAIGTAAANAARLRGYPIDASGNPLAPYTGLLYVFNNVPSCGWSGLAYVGWARAWINNTTSLLVIAHELGHNFGLLHAGSLRCTGATIGCGASGSVSEYGDPFSGMGNNNAGHFNAAQKDILGWIAPSTVKTHAGGTTTYTLSPIETGSQTSYAVKVPTANSNRTYWIEYRQPTGSNFDSFIVPPSFPNNGAQIRIEYPFEKSSGSDDTEILDMTPATSSFGDAALVVGAAAFVDPSTNVSINVVSATPGAGGLLTVQVSTGSPTLFWRHHDDFNYLWNMNINVATPVGLPTVLGAGWVLGGRGDIDGDGVADLIWYYQPTGTVYAWLMSGNTIKANGVVAIGSVGPGWTMETVADLNGDGIADILWRHTSGGVYAWYMNANTTIKSVVSLGAVASPDWRMAGTGNFDGNATKDIVWSYEVAGPTKGAAWAWMMNPLGGVSSVAPLGSNSGMTVAKVADFDGDGKSDLLWRDNATGANQLWFMNGTTKGTTQTMPVMATGWQAAAAMDFNSDGRADLIWFLPTPSGQITQWLMNAPGAAPTVNSLGTVGANWFLPGQ